jgi:hypothetical protein
MPNWLPYEQVVIVRLLSWAPTAVGAVLKHVIRSDNRAGKC